jgi:hypothetical protein
MTRPPTDAQLAALYAWWFGGGSNEAAATALNRRPQTVKNTLMAFRREQGVQRNVELAQRYAVTLAEMHKGSAA